MIENSDGSRAPEDGRGWRVSRPDLSAKPPGPRCHGREQSRVPETALATAGGSAERRDSLGIPHRVLIPRSANRMSGLNRVINGVILVTYERPPGVEINGKKTHYSMRVWGELGNVFVRQDRILSLRTEEQIDLNLRRQHGSINRVCRR